MVWLRLLFLCLHLPTNFTLFKAIVIRDVTEARDVVNLVPIHTDTPYAVPGVDQVNFTSIRCEAIPMFSNTAMEIQYGFS